MPSLAALFWIFGCVRKRPPFALQGVLGNDHLGSACRAVHIVDDVAIFKKQPVHPRGRGHCSENYVNKILQDSFLPLPS